MDDDWDLHAVVRGCATVTTAAITTTTATAAAAFTPDLRPQTRFAGFGVDQDNRFLSFPDPLEARNTMEDLQELYKPFFPKSQSLSPRNISFSSAPNLGASRGQQQPQLQPKEHTKQFRVASGTTTASANTTHPRTKRRKNQLKKLFHVPAEGLSSDVWAWRKYGQKPIKGSPYPRGYYRCSSSKGCLARKQVERNRSDPGMFIVTYTAEHNHPVPTHRNSLAGSIRQKPLTQQAAVTGAEAEQPEPGKALSKPSCTSPVSASNTASSLTEKSENENRAMEEDFVEDDESDELGLSGLVMNDDFFEGLEEITGPVTEDCYSDPFPAKFPLPWLASKAATAAGGS